MSPDDIRKAREKLGWDMRELADKAGVSASTISRIERGVGKVAYENLLAVYRALGLSAPEADVFAENNDERRLISAWRDADYAIILEMIAEKLKGD